MKRGQCWLFLTLIASILLGTSLGAFAEGIGTVTQMGLNNNAHVYQEAFSEVIVMQRGNENSVSIDHEGTEHVTGIGQVGDENKFEAKQLGQRALISTIQLGVGHYANIAQSHLAATGLAARNIFDNDAFAYQTGLEQILNLMQIGDDNTASVYQMDTNNEAYIIQEQSLLVTGPNAVFIVQLGTGNRVTSQQSGSHHHARAVQAGNENRIVINQNGTDNTSTVRQTGNDNTATINQG